LQAEKKNELPLVSSGRPPSAMALTPWKEKASAVVAVPKCSPITIGQIDKLNISFGFLVVSLMNSYWMYLILYF